MHRAPGLRSRHLVLLLAPLGVVIVLALVFGRSLLGSSPGRASGAASAATTTKPAPRSTGSANRAVTLSRAAAIKDLGVVNGDLTLRGPPQAAPDSFVVFVLDGRKRLVRTDATAPFAVTVDTTSLPDGRYTLTVLQVRQGRTSTASTGVVQVQNGTSGATATPAAPRTPAGSGDYPDQVLALTNTQRVNAGCHPLAVNNRLAGTAQAHSADMAARNYFSHNGQDGRSPFDRMKRAGYSFSAAGENIAMGQPSPADVMTAWMNSAGHRSNILNCTYTQIGVGYATGKDGTAYWTQDFAKPM